MHWQFWQPKVADYSELVVLGIMLQKMINIVKFAWLHGNVVLKP